MRSRLYNLSNPEINFPMACGAIESPRRREDRHNEVKIDESANILARRGKGDGVKYNSSQRSSLFNRSHHLTDTTSSHDLYPKDRLYVYVSMYFGASLFGRTGNIS